MADLTTFLSSVYESKIPYGIVLGRSISNERWPVNSIFLTLARYKKSIRIFKKISTSKTPLSAMNERAQKNMNSSGEILKLARAYCARARAPPSKHMEVTHTMRLCLNKNWNLIGSTVSALWSQNSKIQR